jgi:hypothetical protein
MYTNKFIPEKKGTALCRQFKEAGTCRFGDKCNFSHDLEKFRPVIGGGGSSEAPRPVIGGGGSSEAPRPVIGGGGSSEAPRPVIGGGGSSESWNRNKTIPVQGGGLTSATIPVQGGGAPVNEKLPDHLLHSQWAFYEHKKTDVKGGILPSKLTTIKTVEEFWEVLSSQPLSHTISSVLSLDSMSFFKEGIQPWTADVNGHRELRFSLFTTRWNITIIHLFYEAMAIACMGEVLESGSNEQVMGFRMVDRRNWKDPLMRFELWITNPKGTPAEIEEQEANIVMIGKRLEALLNHSLPVPVKFADNSKPAEPEPAAPTHDCTNFTYSERGNGVFNPAMWETPNELKETLSEFGKHRFDKVYIVSLFGNTRFGRPPKWISDRYGSHAKRHEPYGWRECEQFMKSKVNFKSTESSYVVTEAKPITDVEQFSRLLSQLSPENQNTIFDKVLKLTFSDIQQTIDDIISCSKTSTLYIGLYAKLTVQICNQLEKTYQDGKGFRLMFEASCRKELDSNEAVVFIFAELCKHGMFKAAALHDFLIRIMSDPLCESNLMTAARVIERTFDQAFASTSGIREIALGLSNNTTIGKRIKFKYEDLIKNANVWTSVTSSKQGGAASATKAEETNTVKPVETEKLVSDALKEFAKTMVFDKLEHQLQKVDPVTLMIQIVKKVSQDADINWALELLQNRFAKSMMSEKAILEAFNKLLTPSELEDDGDIYYIVPYDSIKEDHVNMPRLIGTILGKLHELKFLSPSFIVNVKAYFERVNSATQGQCSISSPL